MRTLGGPRNTQVGQASGINRYLTDFPPSQDLTQSHFIVGRHARIETHAWLYYGPFGISHIRAPRSPSYGLNPLKKVLPGESALWRQVTQLNNTSLLQTPSRPPENQWQDKPQESDIYPTSHQVRIWHKVILLRGDTHKLRLEYGSHNKKKMLNPVSIPHFGDASDDQQWT